MTREEFTKQLPLLTNNPLPVMPPFLFNGLSTRIFPLRASLDALQRVCDGYLNFVPPEAGYFRVPLPYVYLMVLDYGQVAETVASMGWFAQTEVFFSVPVEWYKLVKGKWVFQDWAVITPYIFVNDDFSVPLGRSVFGFPKVLGRVTQIDSRWIKNSVAPITLARIETSVFPEAYSGADIENRVFLEVEKSTMSGLQMPFDPRNPMWPTAMASNFAQTMAGFARDMTWFAQSMRISPVNPGADPGVLQQMLASMPPWFAPGGQGFVQNSLNLKQFRRSDRPDEICYQALTLGRMETTAFNGGGLLGEYDIMLGDISGGYSIKLSDYSSLPIARTLGLEVHREWRGPDCAVAELKPVMPFWIDVDLIYNKGENLAWRANDGIWKDEAGAPFDPQPPPGGAPAFVNTVSTPIDEIAGPFEYSDSTVRVLPLMAKKKKLKEFVDNFINKPLESPMRGENGKSERVQFKVWAGRAGEKPGEAEEEKSAYVYLTITSFGSVTSINNNVGNWAKYQLAFMIPVQFQRMDEYGNWETVGVGLVPAFSFVDNCVAAISRFEVQGFEETVANFLKPDSAWLSDESEFGANPQQTLLRVDAEVWPALGQGQKATIQPVIEISQGDPDVGLGVAPDTPWRWAESLRAELLAKKNTKDHESEDLKVARALALELLGNQMGFSAYSLKQIRDVTDPNKACYQSLVRVPRSIRQLVDMQEIEETLVVRIHDYPMLDIVGQLGLVARRDPDSASGIVSSAQAIRPFFIRATLYEPLAERMASRAGTPEWTIYTNTAFQTLLSDEEDAPPITADYRAETLQDQMDPSRIGAIMAQAAQRLSWTAAERQVRGAPAIGKDDARRALGKVDPQTVIESVLSREWGNANEDARWRRGRRELIEAFSALPVSSETSAFAESVLYRKTNNQLAFNPGAVASPLPEEVAYYKDFKNLSRAMNRLERIMPTSASERWRAQIEKIILAQEEFTRLERDMESKVSLLASVAILKLQGLTAFHEEFGGTLPTHQELAKTGLELFFALKSIGNQTIEGEPSEHNNLDVRVLADQKRLQELLIELPVGSKTHKEAVDWVETNTDEALTWALDHVGHFGHLVELARKFCGAQNDAFLNKLSRAYQKPDFCILRDSVGAGCDELLPLSLSWDANWYYGRQKEYENHAPLKSSNKSSAPAEGHGVTESVPQGSNG